MYYLIEVVEGIGEDSVTRVSNEHEISWTDVSVVYILGVIGRVNVRYCVGEAEFSELTAADECCVLMVNSRVSLRR